MIVTTAERTVRKLEVGAFQPGWLLAVLQDVDTGLLVEEAEEIVYINRAYAALLGYDEPEELLRRHLSLIVAEEDKARLLEFGRRRHDHEEAPRTYDFAARRRDASAVRLRASVSTSTIERRVLITTMAEPSRSEIVGLPLALQEPHVKLSRRETELLEMILAGRRMKEIAFDLDISPKTVSTHRVRLLRKLRVTDNRELFQYALRHHIIDWS